MAPLIVLALSLVIAHRRAVGTAHLTDAHEGNVGPVDRNQTYDWDRGHDQRRAA